ncbi:MAG: ATP-binding protein [Thermoleophilaceae bacterium]|nr:ATP-binding protein [Thermoleophilaceae bacterium]
MTAGLNPFVYDDPLPPGDLVDREAECTQLFELAEGGHNTRLQAPRRYGKTTLLGKVQADADKVGLHTVYVDFYRALTLAEVARRIEDAYLEGLAGPSRRAVAAVARRWRGKLVATPGGVGAEAESARQSAQQRLSDMLDLPVRVFEPSGIRTLVVFDEFQDLLRIDSDIDGLLRSKIQFHRDEASYIFAGSEPGMLAELFNSRDRPLFEQARPIELGPLADDDLSDYIGKRFERSRRDPGEALDELLTLVRGHPQRAMLAAHHLWEQTPPGETADAETFTRVLEALDRETGERFERTWDLLSDKPNQRKVLAALASSDDTLYGKRTLERFGLERGSARAAATALVNRGEVQRVMPSGFVIVDPLLERWLVQTQT